MKKTGHTQTKQNTQAAQTGFEAKKKSSWGDVNGDGRFDLDDILIGIRETFQWVFSWRGAMALFGLALVGSFALNVASWTAVLAPLGDLAPMAGFVVCGTVQAFETMPIMDDLSLKSSLAGMIRRQRKPLEVPVLNETLNPDAKRLQRRYKRRESNQQIMGEFIRYALYVLLAVLGMVGVEISLRMFNYCGDQLLTRDERDFMRKLQESAKNVSVSLE
jgi:hypothetical protein